MFVLGFFEKVILMFDIEEKNENMLIILFLGSRFVCGIFLVKFFCDMSGKWIWFISCECMNFFLLNFWSEEWWFCFLFCEVIYLLNVLKSFIFWIIRVFFCRNCNMKFLLRLKKLLDLIILFVCKFMIY